MIEIRPVDVSEVQAQAAILADNWDDADLPNKDLFRLQPRWSVYFQLEQADMLMPIGAFDGTKLVGYSVNVVAEHPDYAGLIVCNNSILYVSPAYRRGATALRLMEATKTYARNHGAKLVLWHAPPGGVFDVILRRRRGVRVQETIHSERI